MGCLSNAKTAGKERLGLGLFIFEFLTLCLVLIGGALYSTGLWAQGSAPNTFTPPDCGGVDAQNNSECWWLLAQMEGSLYTGVTPIEGTWTYRYDRWGLPTYIDHRHANGIPATKSFFVHQSKDQPLFEQTFDAADPNNPGGFLKTHLALNIFHPSQGSPHPGKILVKIGMLIDAQNVSAGGPPSLIVYVDLYTYPNPNEMEIERMPVTFDPATGGIRSLGMTKEWYVLDDQERVTQLIKEEKTLVTPYRVDIVNFNYNQSGLASISHGWNDCNLSPNHCGRANNKAELTNGEAQNWIYTEPSYDGEGRLNFLSIKEDRGPNPGDIRDNIFDKEVECQVVYEDNQIPLYHLPKILKDLGFTDTGLPSSLNCETKVGGFETYEVTFQWAPRWRFKY